VCVLRLKDRPEICIEVDSLLPEKISGMKAEEVEKVKIRYGKLLVDAGEFFDVEGKANDTIIFEGNLEKVKRIGFGMTRGEIIVKGNAGMYAGAFIQGGRILIEGNAGSFAALGMKGGEIIIKGDCGDCAGSAYRGSEGMTGGRLIIYGKCGNEAGFGMKGGEMIIGKESGLFLGSGMVGGVIKAETAKRAGSGMRNGQIFLNRYSDDTLPPGFLYSGIEEVDGTAYHVFTGDHAEGKTNGRVFIKSL